MAYTIEVLIGICKRMGLNKRLNKHLIGEVKTKTLEQEQAKLLRRRDRYQELYDRKSSEFDKYEKLSQNLGGLLKDETREAAHSIYNCMALTAQKIDKINSNLKKIENELVERMLTGEA